MSQPDIQNLGQISVGVQDLNRATAFYRDVLGLDHLFTVPPGLSFFMAGDVRLMLSLPEPSADPAFLGTSTLYFKVPSIEAAVSAIRTKTEVLDEPHLIANMGDHELWMAFIKDSEGNALAFMEERPV